MLKVGLTGSIASGKSTVAAMFARKNIPVFDADKAVHTLYAQDGAAVAPIKQLFPECIKDNAVDRSALSHALQDKTKLMQLEHIVHPLVREAEQQFITQAEKDKAPYAILDIPLLFETRKAADFDNIITVYAPLWLRKKRALARGLSAAKLDAILERQLNDAQKKASADFVIHSYISPCFARWQIERVHKKLLESLILL